VTAEVGVERILITTAGWNVVVVDRVIILDLMVSRVQL
jgi:hypothetical protein